MPLASGTRLGPYEIQSAVGAGGMGEVYRALDARIDRTVAIKILPSHLANKPEARERFEREARAISQLNHANICQLYDLGQQDGIHYIVMEYLEGETLATRLAKGRLPLEQVLRYGAEIAEGLDQAHRTGVVHRDLKPGNIMLTRSGAKLMDFGLAKRVTAATPQSSGLSATLTSADASHPLTAEGTILGTYQYMSPEQVEGKDADPRSDIFSFGAVLYEMAAGKRAFDGKSQLSVASAILEREPEPISALQPMAPPALQHILQGALMKDPESRWQSAADIARQLRWISSPESSSGAARPVLPHSTKKWQERAAWAAAVAALLAVVGWLTFFSRPHPHVVRAYLTPPPDVAFDFIGDVSGPPVLSPDGTRVAFTARTPKELSSIWVRKLDSTAAEKLAGTDGAFSQFWSGDGNFIGFFADSKLKKVAASGGPVTIIADASNARGGAWNRDNMIVYAPEYRDSLWKVNANGGTPVRATKLDPTKHSTHRWPTFLPDGKHFLFFATNHAGGRREDNGIYFGSIDSDASQLVLANDAGALYSSGYLLFHQQNALVAQKFDPARGTLSGDPVAVVNDVQNDSGTFHTVFTVADGGVLLYEPGSAGMENTPLLWMDRNGKVLGPIAEPSSYRGAQLSPDGKRLAVAVGDPRSDIWIFDLEHGSRTRLTFDDATHLMPSWSADGQRVAYMSQVGATVMTGSSLHARLANGGGQDELLLERKDVNGVPVTLTWPAWSPDGRYLAYLEQSGPTGTSVSVLPTSGEAKPKLLIKPESAAGKVMFVRFSPDGRWLAYSATDGGREEVYVTSFPEGNGRWQVSREGGTFPVWRHDGKEIFYLGLDAHMFAVSVSGQGSSFEVGTAQSLFDLRNTFALGAPYDVTPDGQRFMVLTKPEGSAAPMMLVLNWNAELK